MQRLLTGDEDRSCTALIAQPHLSQDYAAQIFCKARRGDWSSAALTLEAAHALELLPPEELALLDRFLSPELFEGRAEYLPQPDNPDPLSFRLFEAIGERLALCPAAARLCQCRPAGCGRMEGADRSRRAPDPYRRADPEPVAWVFIPNVRRQRQVQFGIGSPPIQQFETALETGKPRGDQKRRFPGRGNRCAAWGLRFRLPSLFAERLFDEPLPSPGAENLRWRILMLSELYDERAAEMDTAPDSAVETQFLAALGAG